MDTYKILLRLDAALAKDLKKEALKQDRSVNWIINAAIKDYLKNKM